MACEPVDRLPVLAFEPYEQKAIERWRTEGLPEGVEPVDFLGMSRLVEIPVTFRPIPEFDQRVLSEDSQYEVVTSCMGATIRRRKDNPSMFYGHIDHPVKTRADWEAYKERLIASSPGRLPEDWQTVVAPRLNASEDPVGLSLYPFFFRFGFYSMGMERFLTAFYEEPDLMHDIFSYYGRFVTETIRPLLGTVALDYVLLTEDLAGKNGPLISPKIYEEFWYPYQDPIVEMLRAAGVPLICEWTAGRFDVLLPSMLAHGINCTWPLEVLAGMDAPALRERFGCDLAMGGNIAKEAVIAGPEAIDREIERLMPLMREGGFIPGLDDMASPDMPFPHYRYLVERLQSIRTGPDRPRLTHDE
ncbi:uroporphyrinogen decarboxylase family protein [Verrucomicrobiota bacterium]